MKQDLLTFADWTPDAMKNLLQLAVEIKQAPASYSNVLAGSQLLPCLKSRLCEPALASILVSTSLAATWCI